MRFLDELSSAKSHILIEYLIYQMPMIGIYFRLTVNIVARIRVYISCPYVTNRLVLKSLKLIV